VESSALKAAVALLSALLIYELVAADPTMLRAIVLVPAKWIWSLD
jgi:hypothetical protein